MLRLFGLLVAVAVAMAAHAAEAQPYPSRPIRLLLVYPPGGAADLVARAVGQPLAARLGQPVVVENRPGSNGNLAGEVVAHANPDGYTLLLGPSALFGINPHLYAKMSIDPLKDLAPVASVVSNALLLAANPKLGPTNFRDFIAFARSARSPLFYGSIGNGSEHHLAMEMLKQSAGIDLTHVPYKGAGPATADLVAGQVELMVVTPPSVSGHIRSGNVKALALASDQRHPAFPEIPTTAEAGLPGFKLDGWFALFAPAGTPQPIVDRLNAAMRKVARMDITRERANQLGTVLKDWTAAEMDSFAKSEVAEWGKVIRDNNITMD
jgi:tripartite-type tricarboxylate transporter receptor subunit TctC